VFYKEFAALQGLLESQQLVAWLPFAPLMKAPMFFPPLKSFYQSFASSNRKASVRPNRERRHGRRLAIEALEHRQMLSITPLQSINSSQDTGEKPQSKIFQYANEWWTVMPNSSGTWVYRLDGTSWTLTQQITTNKSVHADVKVVGDLAQVLLYNGTSSQLATLQYSGAGNRFEPWSLRPQLVNVPLSSGVETATVEVDSTGRMWIASDAKTTVEVRYSDGLYTSWSAPIIVASGIDSDDISAIVAMPNHQIGVMWSNQSTERFGFRVHVDGAAPTDWSADERPASQSALNVGAGMADDHIHLAVSADGTLYAAVKTSYDKSGYPKIALLVRRPNGSWDNLYSVDSSGTRATIAVDDAAGKLVIAYESKEGGGDILYRESPLGTINLSPVKTMISGSLANVTTAKVTSTNQIVFMADQKSVIYSFDTATPNLPPNVSAGADTTAVVNTPIALAGTATDDGQPAPPALHTLWAPVSGPGTVTFGNSALASTTAAFSAAGTYVLRLTADDGQLSRSDDVSVIVSAAPGGGPENPPPAGGTPQQIAFQNGLFPNVSYVGNIDTKIASKKSTTNYGNDSSFTIDGDPDEAGLFRWDVSAIPVGSSVQSVSIELNVTSSSKDSYEVYALQRAWDELSATWQRYASGSNWAGAGASGSGDQQSTVLGQLAASSKGVYRINLNAAGVAAVQAWINDPSQNFGIIIKDYTASKAVEISTSEAKTASQRPKLVINYTSPPAARAALVMGTLPPVVDVGPNLTAVRGRSIPISGAISTSGKSGGIASLTAVWTKTSGLGTVTFGNDHLATTTVQFSAAGTYALRLTVSDGVLAAFDELTVTVS
jgi:hypothetical protein